MSKRRLGLAAALWLALAPACAADFDFSPEQPGRPHVQADAKAVALLPAVLKLARADALTVAIAPFAPPIATYATDAKTPVGADADIANLAAESLGLKLDSGSIRFAQWAGRHGFHLLIGNLNQGEEHDDFFATQRHHLDLYRRALPASAAPRIALGRVIVPTDGADAASRAHFAAFAQSRLARTRAAGQAADSFRARSRRAFRGYIGGAAARPHSARGSGATARTAYDLSFAQYTQILTDFVERIAPELGWRRA